MFLQFASCLISLISISLNAFSHLLQVILNSLNLFFESSLVTDELVKLCLFALSCKHLNFSSLENVVKSFDLNAQLFILSKLFLDFDFEITIRNNNIILFLINFFDLLNVLFIDFFNLVAHMQNFIVQSIIVLDLCFKISLESEQVFQLFLEFLDLLILGQIVFFSGLHILVILLDFSINLASLLIQSLVLLLQDKLVLAALFLVNVHFSRGFLHNALKVSFSIQDSLNTLLKNLIFFL